MTKSHLKTLFLLIATAIGTSGCVIGTIVKSELSAYAEPTTGELAHIRLIGSRNVKVYPASTCPSVNVVGSGYPAGPQMGGQRKRDLGMPKIQVAPKHYVEIAARAGEPITAAFTVGRYQGAYQLSCSVAGTFVPQAGRNYEMVASWMGTQCVAQAYEIVSAGELNERRRVPTIAAQCARPDPETSPQQG